MSSTRLQYYHWITQIIGTSGADGYSMLLHKLHETPFTFYGHSDSNRYYDGIDLRYRFGQQNDIPDSQIATELDCVPCSMLEMMVALALRIEEQILVDPYYGDRTGVWFWNMIQSLGLLSMTDKHYNKVYVENVIVQFIEHLYLPDGSGSLFHIPGFIGDARKNAIWDQAMLYCNYILR